MHIAQLSVAGEDFSRLEKHEPSENFADQQALDDYACDRSNLPWVIFRAAYRANHLAALPARARALLAALARTVDARRPYAAIFARRELLTGRAMQSMRTFYRSLEDLEKEALITRPPQTRYGAAGLFGRAYLHLTPKVVTLLGLVESGSDTTTNAQNPNERKSNREQPSSLVSPSATVADGAIYKDLYPTSQKRQPGKLPADLERLRGLGFRHFLIFRLMREASEHAKRLSDVVEASWKHLQRAKHPISYLRALLRAPVDFTYRVRTIHEGNVEKKTRIARDIELQRASAELAGQSFVSHDGARTFLVSEDAKSVTTHHRNERHPRTRAGAWATDFLAAIKAGKIVPHRSDAPPAQGSRSKSQIDDTHDLKTSTCSHAAQSRLKALKLLILAKQAGGPNGLPRALNSASVIEKASIEQVPAHTRISSLVADTGYVRAQAGILKKQPTS
ncbi:replication protein O [Caballeronia sp. LZ001]|uniref:replication protein O n=1 Tax=Caballeronia sp. LZ001 TaxID=3038553 RepID=UPI00285C6C78|nr:replication protein O [Caballeronia sp. LZ001]MDR5799498.1 replication protein O [Caballeronia sp. LZ001]